MCIRSNFSTLSSGAMFVAYPDLRTTVIKLKLNIYTKANQLIRVLFDGLKISPNFFGTKGLKFGYLVEVDLIYIDLSLNSISLISPAGL